MAARQLSLQEIAAAVADAVPRQVAAVYLFGSQARGNPRLDSDVDLGLLYVEPPGGTLLEQPFLLESELSAALERPVQCVVMNHAPPDLVHRILREQQLLLDRDPALRVRFEVAARNRYFDVKPFLDRYRKRARVA
jgi:predicted nucleotidyltransferase